jgi:hypothetical protein
MVVNASKISFVFLVKLRAMAQNTDDWKVFERELNSVRSDMSQYSNVGGGRPMTAAELEHAVASNPNALGNDAAVELQWAMKAGKHAETYFNLLETIEDKKKIKLTKSDDAIYTEFRKLFPIPDNEDSRKDDEVLYVGNIRIETLKTEKAKEKWRKFMDTFKGDMRDFDLGTLLRMNSTRDYEPDNCEVVPRLQFVAIEIARNREGHNDSIGKAR